MPKTRKNTFFSMKDLYAKYKSFEGERIEKAKALVGSKKMKPDSFCKFVIQRTDLCPHAMSDASTDYWLDTVNILDGDSGLSLPMQMDMVPAIFFDALSSVRRGRGLAREEDRGD